MMGHGFSTWGGASHMEETHGVETQRKREARWMENGNY